MRKCHIRNSAWFGLFVLLGCGESWQGSFRPLLDIQLNTADGQSLAGADIWMLDLSDFVQASPSRRGAFVCSLDSNGACSSLVKYKFSALREVWQPRFLNPGLSTEERYLLLVAEHDSTSRVLGRIPLPELTLHTYWGYEPIQLRKMEKLVPDRVPDVVRRLKLLALDGRMFHMPDPLQPDEPLSHWALP